MLMFTKQVQKQKQMTLMSIQLYLNDTQRSMVYNPADKNSLHCNEQYLVKVQN